MIKYANRFILMVLLITTMACQSNTAENAPGKTPLADPEATEQTRALFYNLQELAKDNILFGHQDDLAYGVNWINEPGRSDIKAVAGSYPAVYGWELGDLGNAGAKQNLDDVDFEQMKGWIKEGYRRGGVITLSWHMDNPVSGGSSWDTTDAINQMIPGGARHDHYKKMLDRFADFINDLKVTSNGTEVMVPVIFRPFHEHTGGWFWWGEGHVSPDNYKKVWRFTVEYLRSEKDLHNLLYAYSPSSPVEYDYQKYWEKYPGDQYVDLLGFDHYHHSEATSSQIRELGDALGWLVRQAEERNKIAALTEGGFEGIPDEDWWTDVVLASINADPKAKGIAYALFWRNAPNSKNPGHYFAPYPGQMSADNFKQFVDDPLILLEDELPDLYE